MENACIYFYTRTEYPLCFFYKNLFYKNVAAEINQSFKKERSSGWDSIKTFLFC